MKKVAFVSLCRVNQIFCVFCEENRGRKKLEQSRARLKSTDQKRSRSLVLSLSLCCCFQSRPLSSTSSCLFYVRENNESRHKNKEEAKKLAKAEKSKSARNCSKISLFSLSVLFSTRRLLSFLVLFQTIAKREREYSIAEISSTRLNCSVFPTINKHKHVRIRWRLRKPFTSKRSSAT